MKKNNFKEIMNNKYNLIKNIILKGKNLPKKVWVFCLILTIIIIAVIAVLLILVPSNSIDNSYIIQFESNGGTKIDNIKIKKGSNIPEAGNPVKNGFEFLGWNLNGKKYDFNDIIKSDIILTATWKSNGTTEICTVFFDSTGGKLVEAIDVSEGNAISEPICPTRNGYDFLGWYLEDIKFDFSTPINETIALFAKWEKNNNAANSLNENKLNSSIINTDKYPINGTPDSPILPNYGIPIVNGNGDSYNNTPAITWADMEGTWYLTGTDDIIVKIYKDESGNSCFSGIRFSYSTSEVDYTGGSGGSVPSSINPEIFARYYGITLKDGTLIISNSGKLSVFYRQQNYPSRVTSSLEILYNNLQGTWYLYGYDDVYIKFTAGIRYDEKVLYIDRKNFDMANVYPYPMYSYGYSGYYEYYTLKSSMGYDGLSYENDSLIVRKNGKEGKLTRTPFVIPIPVTELTINKQSENIQVGGNAYLTATVYPYYATNQSVTWTSSNNNVATVDASGFVVGVGIGESIITATTNDGYLTKECKINVSPILAQGISINKSNVDLYYNKDITLVATITPTNVTNKSILWSSSNTNVATVSSNGLVKGVSIGEAIITASTYDNSYKANSTIKVGYSPLSVEASLGYVISVSNNEIWKGIECSANVFGGTEQYTYYNFKVYLNGVLIGESTNTLSNTYRISSSANGTYTLNLIVRDSNGTEKEINKTINKYIS